MYMQVGGSPGIYTFRMHPHPCPCTTTPPLFVRIPPVSVCNPALSIVPPPWMPSLLVYIIPKPHPTSPHPPRCMPLLHMYPSLSCVLLPSDPRMQRENGMFESRGKMFDERTEAEDGLHLSMPSSLMFYPGLLLPS